jgi:D-cysteine desulfhydrase/L-cysteate sulfo-lyase
LGATIHTYPKGEDEDGADANLKMIADELRSAGRQPYIIPLAPGHPPLGALGYVRAAEEILDQLGDLEDEIDHIFVASGSGSTHAGLLFGLRSLNWLKPVIGVCVRRNRALQHDRISNRCREVAELLDMDNPVTSEDIRITDETFAPGYGKLNDQTLEAIDLCARREGLLLDPVYTGKSMAACLKHVRNIEKSQSTLFIHTGGTPGLFGYSAELNLAG